MGRGLDGDTLAGAGLTTDRPLGERDPRRAGEASHRSEKGDEGHQVVRTHVKERSSPPLIVEIGVGMPPLVPMVEHERRCRHWLSNSSFVQYVTTGLQATAKKGVWSRPESESARPRGLHQARAIL